MGLCGNLAVSLYSPYNVGPQLYERIPVEKAGKFEKIWENTHQQSNSTEQ